MLIERERGGGRRGSVHLDRGPPFESSVSKDDKRIREYRPDRSRERKAERQRHEQPGPLDEDGGRKANRVISLKAC